MAHPSTQAWRNWSVSFTDREIDALLSALSGVYYQNVKHGSDYRRRRGPGKD